MTDIKYEAARNKLIPFAEKYANENEGKTPNYTTHVGTGMSMQSREEWAKCWNISFLGKMDQLAKEQKLNTGPA